MFGKALKVLAEFKFRAVSCPGVHLPDKDDVYLSLCFMGQGRQSERLPAVFPLLLHEKMTFEKVFRHAVDPADVAVLLQYETVRIELVQLIPPAGDTLACFEDDARCFLFPEPKLVPSFSGMDREVLMTRAPHFPGIAPRLEFSTRTTIMECSADEDVNIHPNVLMNPVLKRRRKWSSRSQASSHQRAQTVTRRQGATVDRDRQGTHPGRSQSPVRAGNTQRLARLSLDSTASSPADWDSVSTSWPDGRISEDDCNSADSHDDSTHSQHPGQSATWRPYQEEAIRSESSSHRVWEEVQDRVRGLLTTPKAVRRLVTGATQSEVDAVLTRTSTPLSTVVTAPSAAAGWSCDHIFARCAESGTLS